MKPEDSLAEIASFAGSKFDATRLTVWLLTLDLPDRPDEGACDEAWADYHDACENIVERMRGMLVKCGA